MPLYPHRLRNKPNPANKKRLNTATLTLLIGSEEVTRVATFTASVTYVVAHKIRSYNENKQANITRSTHDAVYENEKPNQTRSFTNLHLMPPLARVKCKFQIQSSIRRAAARPFHK